ncbi:alpha-tocopherol transfer protein-like [Adelges cooleyi]|uniref:alpha-tocopherol transfer protein-like n=1 Tax=Adelges cooleyi TaxID=133065 RepID=UPI00217F76D3|nr:alpha-tocopherol transfer protein-like [Adelges cooleyi]XP_050428182.1 alpha-tocopherol transfer protein-like [Adelges cooleyi]
MLLLPASETQLEKLKAEEFYQPPERIEEDVTQLMEWLTKQPHLPDVTDRKWLSHFIIGCKYNLQRSKQVIDAYFTVREELPDFFGGLSEQDLKNAAHHGHMSLFPKLTPNGERVFCTRTHPTSDDDQFEAQLIIKTAIAVLDLELKDTPMYGNIILLDLEFVRLNQFLACTPTLTKNLLRCTIDAFPLRVKAIHYVNPPKFMSRLINFFKMFLPNKIKDRLFVHDTYDSLYEHVSKDVLPEKYGGSAGKIEEMEDKLIEHLLQNKEWFESRPRADLSKRPFSEKTDDLGTDGTFKKLAID